MAEIFRSRVEDSYFRRMVRECDGCFDPSEFDPKNIYVLYEFFHPDGSYGEAYFPSQAAANHVRGHILTETCCSEIPEHKRCRVSRA